MTYINTSSPGISLSLQAIKEENPETSFPRNPTDEHLNPLGYAVLHPTSRPSGDVVTKGVPEQGEDGKWYQTWNVRDFTSEELQENLDRSKTRAIKNINNSYEEEMKELVKGYPETERESWGKQESEARAWTVDNTHPTPFIDAVLSVRPNITKTELVDRIITKADTFATASGQITGKRHNLEKEIEDAYQSNDITTIESIKWS